MDICSFTPSPPLCTVIYIGSSFATLLHKLVERKRERGWVGGWVGDWSARGRVKKREVKGGRYWVDEKSDKGAARGRG